VLLPVMRPGSIQRVQSRWIHLNRVGTDRGANVGPEREEDNRGFKAAPMLCRWCLTL
jgi:hypothetical protein